MFNIKKITASLVMVVAASAAFGQGYLNFVNNANSNIYTNNTQNYLGQALSGSANGLTTGSGSAPQGYYYALLVQSYSGTIANNSITNLTANNWTFGGLYATNSLSAGREGGPTDGPVTGTSPGGSYQFAVVGWSSNESTGANWLTVSNSLVTGTWNNPNGFVGISSVGVIASLAGPPNATASTLFGASPAITGAITLYSVTAVPEPSTMALAALGGASLLLFRRRQSKK